jgi:hypothetical protein
VQALSSRQHLQHQTVASAPLSAGLSVLMQPPSLAAAAVPEVRESSGGGFGSSSRGCYLCSRCGQPKKGHTCAGIVTAMARSSQTDLAITGTPGRQELAQRAAAQAVAKAQHAVASAVVEEDQMQTVPACIEEDQLGALIFVANNADGCDGGGGGGRRGGALVAASATSEVRMPTAEATQRPSICQGEVGVAAAACSTSTSCSTSCSSSIADGL